MDRMRGFELLSMVDDFRKKEKEEGPFPEPEPWFCDICGDEGAFKVYPAYVGEPAYYCSEHLRQRVQCPMCDGVVGRSEVAPVIPGSDVMYCTACRRSFSGAVRP